MATIGICLIATNKYKQFVAHLLEGIEKHFFNGHRVNVYLFTDNPTYFSSLSLDYSSKVKIYMHIIPAYTFPYATLYRYKIFSMHRSFIEHGFPCDYVFYSDADMAFVREVDASILPSESERLVATLHPGFFNGGGSWGNNPASLSFTPVDKRLKYYAGGFQGGVTSAYLDVCEQLALSIKNDEERGVMAEWHDETHWNCYLATHPGFKVLTPEYCMVEQTNLRVRWGINHFVPKIVALSKNHEEIRS